MELNALHLIGDAYRELETATTMANVHFERVEAAESEFESVEALYQSRKITLDLLLDVQRRLAQAERDSYAATVQRALADMNVRFWRGTLLQDRGMKLGETDGSAISVDPGAKP
jgi:outer membrane protein TolC